MNISKANAGGVTVGSGERRSKLGWDKKLYLLLFGLVLATGTKLVVNGLFPGPLPASEYPGLGGDFTLVGANGPVSLHDFRGRVVVLFFGYSHCQDVCVTALANVAAALRHLKEMGEADSVQALFVTLDPQRDSVTRLSCFTAYFHPAILGLSGAVAQIEKAARRFGVGYKKSTAGPTDYAMSHSGYLYVIRPDGSVGQVLRHNSSPKALVEAVLSWLPWVDAEAVGIWRR